MFELAEAMQGTGFLAMDASPQYHSLVQSVYCDGLKLIVVTTLGSPGRVWQGPLEKPPASLASHLAALSAPGRGRSLHV